MFRSFFILTLLSISFNSYAERCEGFNACLDLYTKLSGHKIMPDATISDEMSLASQDADLTAKNASAEFIKFLNKNVVSMSGDKIIANRSGEFLSAPIYVVSEGNIPRVMNEKGLVTLVYNAKGNVSKLAASTRGMLSKKMPSHKSVNKIVEYKDTKVLAVSDTYEVALKIVKQMMKQDK